MKTEFHIALPSEKLMIHQWQEMPKLFEAICWRNRPYRTKLVFTSYCMN